MALDDKKFIDFLKGLNELEGEKPKKSSTIKEITTKYASIVKTYLTNYNITSTNYGLRISKKEKK